MQPLTKKLNHVLTLMLTIAALMVGQSSVWAASTFTISASHNSSTKETTFTITRTTNTSTSEKVLYHTVGLSAIEGQHFARVYGELSFDISHNERSITINEITPNVNAYLYQNGTTRQYRFEVLDRGGFHLAHYDRTITTGSNVSGSAFDIKDVTVNSGTITVQDKDYKQAYHEIPVATYFSNSAPKDYFVLADAELRMTLTFQAKEKDDGYQHLQLLVNHPEPTDNQKNWDDATSTENNHTAIGRFYVNKYYAFMGTFDGDGYTVRGIRIYKKDNTDACKYQGLFAYIGQQGIVRNITLDDSRITGHTFSGGIAGNNSGTVENCHVTNQVLIHALLSNGNKHGGIAGLNSTVSPRQRGYISIMVKR